MKIEDRIVSGSPKLIYSLPGSLFEYGKEVMGNDESILSGVQYIFRLYDSSYYRHSPHVDMMIDDDHPWSEELLKSYSSERHCHSAASIVLQVDEAVIEKSVITFRNNEKNSILYETFRFPDRAGKEEIFLQDNELEESYKLEDNIKYLYIGSAGSFNYGHWLVDDLPRAKAWLDLRDRLKIAPVILLPSYGEKMDYLRVRSLKLLIDPEVEVEFIDPDKPVKIKNLYFATPVSFHPRIKNPSAIHFVREQAHIHVQRQYREPSRKLFVARRAPNSRAIVNFDEVWAFLSKRGFEMVEPEALDFADQIALFQDAKIVVGQMGAAMTGTMFCQPATSLIYLAPIGWAEPFYIDLAAVAGQHYNVLAGPAANEGPAYLSDFTIPINHLYHRLTYMGYLEREADGASAHLTDI